MADLPLHKHPHEAPLRLGARQLTRLQRWMSTAARESLEIAVGRPGGAMPLPATPADRRGALRRQLETTATVCPISAGGPGGLRRASVVDVSRDGIALRLAGALTRGQSISLQIDPPSAPTGGETLLRRRAQGEDPIRILAVVRYCRSDEAGSYVLGCSFGAHWAASLASEILPPDLRALRKSA